MPNAMLSPDAALAVAEAAYALDDEDDAWRRSLAVAFVRAIDDGSGGACYRFDARGETLELTGRVCVGAAASSSPMTLAPPSQVLRELCRGRPRLFCCSDASIHAGDALTLAGLPAASGGDHQALLLIASDGRGTGWLIGAAARGGARLSITQRRRWQRVAAHIAAAGQLRGALAAALPRSAEAPDAQNLTTRLRAMAIASLDSTDGPADQSAIETDVAWSALATGSWSLVDLFETEGRSVVIARRNATDAPDPRALSPREREVAERAARGWSGKEIAYELGLRTPTVSQLLQRAVRKLRAASAVQLGSVIRALGHLGIKRDAS